MNIRTDLALEAHEIALADGKKLGGVKTDRKEFGALVADLVEIIDENGSSITGKPVGKYITLEVGKLWNDDSAVFKDKAFALAQAVRELMPEDISGEILVAGLGNRHITPDAIGPLAMDSLIVTRHIKKERPMLFDQLGLSQIAAISPGVLGQTGIESADILKSVAEKLKPAALIAVDALAARNISRLVTTVQLSDSGFSPGSGVGNHRMPIDSNTMGCPVITIGVPTVVDAATLACDAASSAGISVNCEDINSYLSKAQLNFFVTPKESDSIMKNIGRLIGYALNLALNPGLEYESMLTLAAC